MRKHKKKHAQGFPLSEVHVMQKRGRNTSPHLWVQRGGGKNWQEINWWTQAMERGGRGLEREVGTLNGKPVQALREYVAEFEKLSRKEKLRN